MKQGWRWSCAACLMGLIVMSPLAASSRAAALPAPAPAQDRMSPVDLVQITLIVPGKITIGKRFRVLDEVESVGDAPPGQSVTFYYLSKDDKLDEADLRFGGRRVAPIPTGKVSQETTWLTLPDTVEPGVYYVIAMANAEKTVVERYLDNNTRATKVTVLPAEPKK